MAKAWQYENPRDRDNVVAVARTPDGLTIEVSDEKAVDSYSSYFTCDINLPLREAQALRDWLIHNLPKKPAPCRHDYDKYGLAPNRCFVCGEVRVTSEDAPDATPQDTDR